MNMQRRHFLAGVGGMAAAAKFGVAAPRAAQAAQLPGFNPAALVAQANEDGEFQTTALFWNARVRMEVG